MANEVEKLEKFYNEQIEGQVKFQVGDIVTGLHTKANRSFPMLVVHINKNPSDDEPIKVIYFDEDEDFRISWFSTYNLVLIKSLHDVG